MDVHVRHQLSNMTDFSEAMTLEYYLGDPILGRALRRYDLGYLLEKVRNYLAGWKAKQLTLVGRITLSKQVIQAILVYHMMCMIIPKSDLKETVNLQWSFIWSDSEEGRTTHMIGWQTLTLPKKIWGFSVHSLPVMNEACIVKLGLLFKTWDARLLGLGYDSQIWTWNNY
jgi:hypothetical protein